MTIQSWIIVIVNAVGWIASIVLFLRKQERDKMKFEASVDKQISLIESEHKSDIITLKEDVSRVVKDFHQHEIANEKQFDNYNSDVNKKFEDLLKKIDELKNMLFDLAVKGVFTKEE